MSSYFLLALFFALIAAAILISQSGRAHELDSAKLIANEKHLKVKLPFKLSGRLDQAWRLKSNVIVLTETKKRAYAKTYSSDQVQLSLYRMLMQGQTKYKKAQFADYGYVRIPCKNNPPKLIKVDLFKPEELVELYKAYCDTICGRINAPGSGSQAVCMGCGHYDDCSVKLPIVLQ